MSSNRKTGQQMHQLLVKAFPICRSITGNGVRETLSMISDIIPLTLHEVPTGTKVFDWTVPKEWNIRNAYIADESGNKIIDFRNNNLHVVGYSTPIDKRLTLSELQKHLHSLPQQPEAIPYITSYYNENWGFCLPHKIRESLSEQKYHVYIDSSLENGNLTYGEYLLKGQSKKEILISTYVCHPSMANNELSGPVVTTFIARWLASMPRKYSYRIIFIPETIGSITYLSRNLNEMKENVIAGFNISCIGDERAYSYVASRYENTLADKVANSALMELDPDYIKYSFLERGSDERQYCSPGVDLPLVTLCRSRFGSYPEYHTSLDDLKLVTEKGLLGGYNLLKNCLSVIENNRVFRVICLCEPQLGKRGLYPSLSTKESGAVVRTMMNVIAYSDGTNDIVDICNIIDKPFNEVLSIANKLFEAGLLEEVS